MADGYSNLVELILTDPFEIRYPHLLYFAFVSRARGLHEGIVDQIEANNPHSVFPLLRTYTELVSYLLYCNLHPHYIDVMLNVGPEKNRSKKGITAIRDAILDSAPGLKKVYDTLSRYTHFNEVGIYNQIQYVEGEPLKFSWSEYPRWKNENDFRVACSHAHELLHGFFDHTELFGKIFL